MKIGISTPQDFVALLIRRRWWVIAPFIALFSIFTILTKHLPKIYVSESLVQVRPRDIPTDIVRDLISGSTEQRLQSIKQTVMSRNNLVAILNEFKDKLPDFQHLNTDVAVEKLRQQIDIKFTSADVRGAASGVTSFSILYQNKVPETAQRICSKLTSLFIDQDSRSRESHVQGTTGFLSSELDKKAAELKESDEKLRVLKSRHQANLPQQLDANQKNLDRLNEQKTRNLEALDRATTQRINYEQLLAQVPEFLPVAPQTAPSRAAAPIEDPLIPEYRATKLEYDRLRAEKGENYPDVEAVRRKLENLKRMIPPDALEAVLRPPVPAGGDGEPKEIKQPVNPAYTNLRNQLRDLETDTELRKREAKRIDSEIARYTKLVDSTPQVELQLSSIIRENEDIRKQYEDLNEKLTEAKLAESLENRQRAEQFVILDPANFPLESSKPNKRALLAVCLFISLAVGIGIAFVADLARQRIWTQSQVEALWGVPVMVDIPEIVTDAGMAELKRKKRVAAMCSIVAAAIFSICLYGIYLNNGRILGKLSPVLEPLVYR